MPLYILPAVPSEGNYDFGTTIEQVGYIIAIQWNTRDKTIDDDGNVLVDGAWYFSVYDVANNPIQTGIKIVLGTFLGKRANHPLFTNGVFIARDMSGQEKDPGFDDLGARVQFFYVPNIDLAKVLGSG